MKILKLITFGIFFLVTTNSTNAQVSVNVNIGGPPAWCPTGYSNVDYYYLPDVEAYYDIRNSNFIYLGGGKWIRSINLPNQYKNYNLYNGYKVVLTDYHGSRPYSNFKNHKEKYYKGYKGKFNNHKGHNNKHSVYVSSRRHDNYSRNDKNKKHDNKRENDHNHGRNKEKGNKHDRD